MCNREGESVRVLERKCMCSYVTESVCVHMLERDSVCVHMIQRECGCVCSYAERECLCLRVTRTTTSLMGAPA